MVNLKPKMINVFRQMKSRQLSLWSQSARSRLAAGIASAKKIQARQLLLACFGIFAGMAAAHTVHSMLPKSVAFSYSSVTCINNPTFLPRMHKPVASEAYQPTLSEGFSVRGYPLFSGQTCVNTANVPPENMTENAKIKFFGRSFLSKSINISTPEYPRLIVPDAIDKKIPVRASLDFSLDTKDIVFDYILASEDKQTVCDKNGEGILCSAEKLGLEQGQTYELRIERKFKEDPMDTLLEKTITTLDPVVVEETSIEQDAIVYEKPESITLAFNKPIENIGQIQLKQVSGEEESIETQISLDEKEVTLDFEEELAREEEFELAIEDVEGSDNSFLDEPFVLKFETSGGPKINGVNIGSYRVDVRPNVIVTFDQPVSEEDLGSHVFIRTSDGRVDSSVSTQGNTVVIRPSKALPRCRNFSVRVDSELASVHGVERGSGWQHDTRTICQTVNTIGRSVRGRGILAYRFGSGSSIVMFVGGLHGNEQSSKYILDSLIPDLERNAQNIPDGRSVIVIPNASPDSIAAGSRFNARGVDLNRNFPTSDWKEDVIVPGGHTAKGGGGSAPLSEPESKALANYILANRPRLLLTYHAHASVVISNDSGDSRTHARTYGQKAGYRYGSAAQTCQFFSYCDTTGELEDWLHEKHGIPALLVELATTHLNEFNRNKEAIWSMIRL